ncbi:hypothetical protein C8R44DRAFT_757524, partial [Mycena epipterygia]
MSPVSICTMMSAGVAHDIPEPDRGACLSHETKFFVLHAKRYAVSSSYTASPVKLLPRVVPN